MPSSRFIFGTLPYYSVLIVTGMVLAILLAQREEKRLGLPRDTVIDLALVLIPAAVLCARIYYVVFAWDSFRSHPLSVFAIWEGGLAIYGGILGGIVCVLLFAHFRHLSALLLLDMVVPGVALAQAIGRWGNFFNMEAYGIPVTNPALQFFPFAVQIPEGSLLVWHMATFFYESCWNLMIFLVLYFLRRRCHQTGQLFLLYSLLYAAGRLIIEGLRTDSLTAGSIRISQLLAFAICIMVLVWMLLRSRPVRPGRWIWIFISCQLLPFFLLPRAAAENIVLPYFFLLLICLFPCVLLSSVHSRRQKAVSILLDLSAWIAYAFFAPKSSFSFCVIFSFSALLLGAVLSCPAFQSDTEVPHADNAAA